MHLITSQHLPLNCICVFKASSSFFPRHLQPLASLSRFFFIFPISSPFCRRSLNFLIVSNSFHFSCVCPFPPSVEVVPPPVLPAPDGVFYSVNFLMNVAVSQLFYCLPSEWGMAIFFHTSNALYSPQRAIPGKKQRNNSSAGGNEPVFADSVAY